MSPLKRRGLQQYGQISSGTEASFASPHRLVQMLMEGALDKIATAKGHMERKQYDGKSRYISWAISIINGLRSSLDLEQGGEIAANLDSLYDYMVRRLLNANVENDTAALDEVSSLLVEVKSAWDALPEQTTGSAPQPATGKAHEAP